MSDVPIIGDVVAPLVTAPFRLIEGGLGMAMPRQPQAPRLPKPPSPDDPAIQAAMEEERRAQARIRGRASTILTGAGGVEGETVSRRTLLGA